MAPGIQVLNTMPPLTATTLPNSDAALSILENAPQTFLRPTPALQSAMLQLAKQYLDPLAKEVSENQVKRLEEERRFRKLKRKRRGGAGDEEEEAEVLKEGPLRMKRVHIEGLGVQQVWEQARRVLNAAVGEVRRGRGLLVEDEEDDEEVEGGSGEDEENDGRRGVRFEDEEDESSELGEEGVDWVYDGDDQGDGEDEEVQDEDDEVEDMLEKGMDENEDEDEEELLPTESKRGAGKSGGTYVSDKFGLNDGFFSIDQFNKRSEFLERQDAKGDPDDGAASDEEDIDWEADPFAMSLPAATGTGKTGGLDDDEDEDDEEGPTFGNADLDAPEGESEEEDDLDVQMDDMGNTNNVLYADFFQPPPQRASAKKAREREALGKDDAPGVDDDLREETIEQTMSRVQRDLFEDDLSDDLDEDDDEDGHGEAKTPSNLSSHERAQREIRAQIRELEAENVASKPWALTGEAESSARPLNSLLEEDLDFGRAGKPVPVITAEVTESIEALIKRRILALEFDEVIRRRPTDLVPGVSAARRGRIAELSDQKPTQGLADDYADDIARRNDPTVADARSTALKKQHAEIEALWIKVSGQLDSLSNWHYKPKPAAAALEVRVDAPTIQLEEARPDAADGGGESALAPQEVYRAGDAGKAAGEVLTKGGLAVGKEEMTREQKLRRRRREKERMRKAQAPNGKSQGARNGNGNGNGRNGGSTEANGKGGKASNDEVLNQLKKSGVKIIGKSGELRDVSGKALLEKETPVQGAGRLKL